MKNQKQFILLAALLAVGVAAYVGWAAMRARNNLVTLDVRNMDVREVVRKIEHQTWKHIYVDKNVRGKVSLRVRGVPLQEVLAVIGEQTGSRPLVLYPLYSTGHSLAKLEQSVRGEIDPASNGWKNLLAAFGGGGPGGPPGAGPMMAMFGGPGGGPGGNPFGAMVDNPDLRVSLDIKSKDVSLAVAAFGRFAQARVVPEDGTAGQVSLSLIKVPVMKAVAQLAKKANRNWTKVYVLRPGFGGPGGPGGPGRPGMNGAQMAMRDGGPFGPGRGPGGRGGPDGPPELTQQQRDEMRLQRESIEQELRSVLPQDERQKLEQEQARREELMRDMANLTPEQRRERMAQLGFNPAAMDKMNRQRVLNSTPEQRSEMTRREKEMRQRFGQQQGPPPR